MGKRRKLAHNAQQPRKHGKPGGGGSGGGSGDSESGGSGSGSGGGDGSAGTAPDDGAAAPATTAPEADEQAAGQLPNTGSDPRALLLLGAGDIDERVFRETMSVIVKHRSDLDVVAERVGVKLGAPA